MTLVPALAKPCDLGLSPHSSARLFPHPQSGKTRPPARGVVGVAARCGTAHGLHSVLRVVAAPGGVGRSEAAPYADADGPCRRQR